MFCGQSIRLKHLAFPKTKAFSGFLSNDHFPTFSKVLLIKRPSSHLSPKMKSSFTTLFVGSRELLVLGT